MISSYNSVVITFFIVSYIYMIQTLPSLILLSTFFLFFLNMIFYPKYHTIPYKLIFTIPTRPINLQSFSFIRASKFKRLQAHAQEQQFIDQCSVLGLCLFSTPWLKKYLIMTQKCRLQATLYLICGILERVGVVVNNKLDSA